MLFVRQAVLTLAVTVAIACVQPVRAADTPPASVDQLLARIRAEHPNARVLKVELLPSTVASGAGALYEVKLFPADGRIIKLVYDARTLALVEVIGGSDYGEPERRRLRLRRGWPPGQRE